MKRGPELTFGASFVRQVFGLWEGSPIWSLGIQILDSEYHV